jgi:hypothetical protein
VRQHLNAFRVAKLLMADGLNDWEREFLNSIATQQKLSPKQQAKLNKLAAACGIGEAR